MSKSIAGTTRAKLLDAAREQFAARGFHGASLAQIAGELGITKQALLYHFRRKEDLYAEVIKSISERLLAAMRAGSSPDKSPAQQFEDIILGIHSSAIENPLDTRVLMRELLDNQRRDAPAQEWYFKTFLDEIVVALDAIGNWAERPQALKLARIYLLCSAIEYFVASRAMLERFYGERNHAAIARDFREELRAQVHRLVEDGR